MRIEIVCTKDTVTRGARIVPQIIFKRGRFERTIIKGARYLLEVILNVRFQLLRTMAVN